MRQRSPTLRSTQRGVTLIELFVVLALIAILAAMASPYFVSLKDRFRLNSASRDVATLIKRARVIAVTRNAWVRLLFTETDSGTAVMANEGVIQLEIRSYNNDGTWTYKPVEKIERPDALDGTSAYGVLPPDECIYSGGKKADNCVDLKALYPDSAIGLVWVDDVGTDSYYSNSAQEAYNDTGHPALFFSPSGRVENLLTDFSLGKSSNVIIVSVAHKTSGGRLDPRVLQIDRGGNVTLWKNDGTKPY